MRITNAHLIAYSPTGTTLKNISHLAFGMGFSGPKVTNLTLPKEREESLVPRESVAIFGAPVYAGRVAPHAVDRLKRVKGEGGPAVVVAVYGNRAYENALIELKHLVEEQGFHVVAAAALLAEHSFSSDKKPLAKGRPDSQDLAVAENFGREVRDRLERVEGLSAMSQLQVPGELPSEPFAGLSGMSPETDASLCKGCGLCVDACPAGALSLSKKKPVTDTTCCTYCLACLRTCPSGAISVTTPFILEIVEKLYANCQARCEPEFFLS